MCPRAAGACSGRWSDRSLYFPERNVASPVGRGTAPLFIRSQPGGYAGPGRREHLGLEQLTVRAGEVHFRDPPGYIWLPEPSQSLVKELSLLHLFRSAGSDEEEHVPIEAAELAGLRKEYPSRRF